MGGPGSGAWQREPTACTVSWCDETAPHTEHQHYAGSWHGAHPTKNRAMTVQVLMTGSSQPRPCLTIVDSQPTLPWLSVELDWTDISRLAKSLTTLARRYGPAA